MRANRAHTVVVTGASSGVGRATALAFAREGAKIGLLARGPDALEATRKEVEAAGGQGVAITADVADPSQVEQAASEVESAFGEIDIWVNNAMVSVFAPFVGITPEEYRRVTEVTYLGTVHGTMAALRRMMRRDHGSIVQVGSALAYRAIPLQSAYCGAKHAIEGFTESLRCELLHEGSHVRVTMVQLPALNTPQFDVVRSKLPRRPQPVPPIYQPEVAAEAIVWAARHPRREIWVGGSTVAALSGNKVAADIGDRYLARTGYDSQQTDEAASADRPGNLWESIPGDRGAHGRFGSVARPSSVQLKLNFHRRKLLLGAGGLGVCAIARAWERRRR